MASDADAQTAVSPKNHGLRLPLPKPLKDTPWGSVSPLQHPQPHVKLHAARYPCSEAVILILWLLSPDWFFWEPIGVIKKEFFNNFQLLHTCKQNSHRAAWKHCVKATTCP